MPVDTAFYWQSAIRCVTRPSDDICRSYICVADTASECLSPRRCFEWSRRTLLTYRLVGAELPKSFCMRIRKIAVKDFIGCATSAPYGSSPRVSVRVVDSSGDFSSKHCSVVKSVGHKKFRMLKSILPMGVAPESVVES